MSNSEFSDGSGLAANATGPAPAPPAVPPATDGRGAALARTTSDGGDGGPRPVARKLSPAGAIRPMAPAGTSPAQPPATSPAQPPAVPQALPAPVAQASPAPRAPAPTPAAPPAAPPQPAARPDAAAAMAFGNAAPIDAFLAPGQEHRLRDLLAFGMAAEAGKAATPEAVDAMRRQADAALEAYAFRSLHNRVEEIRRAAIDEQLGKLRQTPGFQGIVVANLVAMVAAAMIALLLWWLHAVFSMGS